MHVNWSAIFTENNPPKNSVLILIFHSHNSLGPIRGALEKRCFNIPDIIVKIQLRSQNEGHGLYDNLVKVWTQGQGRREAAAISTNISISVWCNCDGAVTLQTALIWHHLLNLKLQRHLALFFSAVSATMADLDMKSSAQVTSCFFLVFFFSKNPPKINVTVARNAPRTN